MTSTRRVEKLSVRKISPRFLFQDEHIEIADLALAGVSTRGIAKRRGRAPSTISRELRSNGPTGAVSSSASRPPTLSYAGALPARVGAPASHGPGSPAALNAPGAIIDEHMEI